MGNKWDRKYPSYEGERFPISYPGDINVRNSGRKVVYEHCADKPFEATLCFEGFERGRSAAHTIFQDENGNQVVMFLSSLADLIESGKLGNSKSITGPWVVVKQGENYGIALYIDKNGKKKEPRVTRR